MFSCEFCEISKNTSSTEHLWMAAKQEKNEAPFVLSWGDFWIVWTCHGILCFHFYFFVWKQRYKRAIGWKQLLSLLCFFLKVSFRKYFITAMFQVLFQQLRGNLTTAFERHLTTEYFMDIGVKLAPRHLTYYCMLLFLSNKPSF